MIWNGLISIQNIFKNSLPGSEVRPIDSFVLKFLLTVKTKNDQKKSQMVAWNNNMETDKQTLPKEFSTPIWQIIVKFIIITLIAGTKYKASKHLSYRRRKYAHRVQKGQSQFY